MQALHSAFRAFHFTKATIADRSSYEPDSQHVGVFELSFRDVIKLKAPWIAAVYRYFKWNCLVGPRWRRMGLRAVFTEHFRNNYWKNPESCSGRGSTLMRTMEIRKELPEILRQIEAKILLDIPCGDFNWMKEVDLPVQYIGADIVEEIVARNQTLYGSASRSFVVLDITSDPLPRSDVILCRDCFIHLSFDHIGKAIDNIRNSGARYLLASTNSHVPENRDIVSGAGHFIDLQKPPISLPEPILTVKERNSDPPQPDDKYLGLWRIAGL